MSSSIFPNSSHVHTSVTKYAISSLPYTAMFRVTPEGFVNGENNIHFIFLILCNGQIQTVEHTLILTVVIRSESSFSVEVISHTDPVGSDICECNITAHLPSDSVQVTIEFCGDYTILFHYSIIGGVSDFRGNILITHYIALARWKKL